MNPMTKSTKHTPLRSPTAPDRRVPHRAQGAAVRTVHVTAGTVTLTLHAAALHCSPSILDAAPSSCTLTHRDRMPLMPLFTVLHYLLVECRPIFLVWWSSLTIVSDIIISRSFRTERFVNKEMMECMQKWAAEVVWRPSAVTCGAGSRAIYYRVQDWSWCDCPDTQTWGSFNYEGQIDDIQSGESAPIGKRGFCLSSGNNTHPLARTSYTDTCGSVPTDGTVAGYDRPL